MDFFLTEQKQSDNIQIRLKKEGYTWKICSKRK